MSGIARPSSDRNGLSRRRERLAPAASASSSNGRPDRSRCSSFAMPWAHGTCFRRTGAVRRWARAASLPDRSLQAPAASEYDAIAARSAATHRAREHRCDEPVLRLGDCEPPAGARTPTAHRFDQMIDKRGNGRRNRRFAEVDGASHLGRIDRHAPLPGIDAMADGRLQCVMHFLKARRAAP